jgi:transposase
MKRKTYSSDFKLKVVLESMQRDTTIETVRRKYSLPASVINKWRAIFRKSAHSVFEQQTKTTKTPPSESPEQLKAIIGDISVENALLKKH